MIKKEQKEMAPKRKTFKQVQDVFSHNEVEIEKLGTSYHFEIINNDEKVHVYAKLKMNEIIESVEEHGVASFIEKYDYAKKEKMKKAKKKTTKKATKKALAKEKAINKAEIEKIRTRMTEITLITLNLAFKKGTKEHLALRKELHELNDRLIVLGGKPARRI